MWALARAGESSLPFIKEHLQLPDEKVIRQQIERAISNLDAPRYTVREKASKDLEEIGSTSLPYLHLALPHATKNLELQTRLAKLIEKLQKSGYVRNESQWRTLQVIRILEQSDPKSAQPLLEKIALAKLSAGLSEEAQAVLERKAKR